jgi:hypothetical protein
MTLSLSLIILFLLSSCSSIRPEKEIVTVTEFVQTKIPIVLHPKPVNLNDVKIYVVSPSENFEEFMSEFEKKNGTDSYIAISVKDYENLSKNFAELKRYIKQQKEIIVYYEDAVTNEPETENR